MEVEHFSHEHPLTVNEVYEFKFNADEVLHICKGCNEEIFSGPLYSCSLGSCNFFFLCKSCFELPLQIQHPLHTQHSLTLIPDPPRYCNCNICGKESTSFTFTCSLCTYHLDIRCALQSLINIEHQSHQHPLVLLRERVSLSCDACCTKREDMFYTCPTCITQFHDQFFIHQECALKPTTLKHSAHDHHLNLAFFIPPEYSQFQLYCEICSQLVDPDNWAYYCGGCRYFVHINCTWEPSSSKTNIAVEDFNGVVFHLPFDSVSVNVVSHFLKEMKLEENQKEEKKELKHISHNHPLIFVDDHSEDDKSCSGSKSSLMSNEKYCKGCRYRVLDTPFYSCSRADCDFSLHQCCAKLPTELQHQCHPSHPLTLLQKSSIARFRCKFCGVWENKSQFSFQCSSINCQFNNIHVKCALLPYVVRHEAHRRHLLVLEYFADAFGWCDACGQNVSSRFAYKCNTCNFKLHIHCSLIPRTLGHRYDEHPFNLNYLPLKEYQREYLCEICEKEFDPKLWFYHCVDCDQSLCILCGVDWHYDQDMY